MSFDKGIDINAMFAEAANAAENTGEEDPELYNSDPTVKGIDEFQDKLNKESKESETSKNDYKEKPIEKPVEKPIEKPVEEPVEKPIERNVKVDQVNKVDQVDKYEQTQSTEANQNQDEQSRNTSTFNNIQNENTSIQSDLKVNQTIDIATITKIIEMKEVLCSYNQTELQFVKGYFQKEDGTSAEVIYEALTVNEKELSALNKIVIARKHTAAERAFYLMDLDNKSIEAICEQIELLTGEFGELQTVDELNKIGICRKLESSISTMPADVFTYINKLQKFTNIALKK